MLKYSLLNPLTARLFAAIGQREEGLALTQLASALADGANPNAFRPNRLGLSAFRANSVGLSVLEEALTLDQPWAHKLAFALLDAGANPILHEARSPTPALVVAARRGRRETALALLNRGHSARVATKEGWTPFLAAAARGDFELCEILAPRSDVRAHIEDGDKGEQADAAIFFIRAEKPELAIQAYQRGWGDPARVAKARYTPLSLAVKGQFDDLVAYLAEDPKALAASSGVGVKTAMHHAVAAGKRFGGGRPDYVRLLAEKGHALDPLDEYGVSPLAFAFLQCAPNCAKVLIEAGADPTARISDPALGIKELDRVVGMDALFAAISINKPWAFELAKDFAPSCDRSAQTFIDGCGALHYAADIENSELSALWTRLLLDLGWDPMGCDGNGQPALMWAMGRGNYETMDLLIPRTDLSHKSKSGLDVFEAGEWLVSEQNQPGSLGKLHSHVDRSALMAETASATVNIKIKPRGI